MLSAWERATLRRPLVDDEPELARTLAASVQQRLAFGERVGQQVRRMGSGFGYEGEHPALTGPRCASVNGFSLRALHKQHDIRELERELCSPGVLETSWTHRRIPASDGLQTSKEEGKCSMPGKGTQGRNSLVPRCQCTS